MTVRHALFSTALLLIVACGSSGGDDPTNTPGGPDPSATTNPPSPTSTTTTDPPPPPKPTVTDLHIADAQLADDGTTISLAWSAISEGKSYRIERAPSEGGKPGAFVALDTSTSPTVQTYTDKKKVTADAFYRIVTISDKGEGPSEPLAAYPVAKSSYSIPGQPLDGAPFNVELGAEVRYPKTSTPKAFPLVLMMHGNHAICNTAVRGDYCPSEASRSTGNVSNACTGGNTVPNHLGYLYLIETLAARGYVAASIDANALTCRNSSNAYIAQRTQLVLEHLRRWKTFAATGGPDPLGTALVGAVDLTKVGLMGHSRGGDAVAGVPEAIAATPIDGVSVKSVLAVAPTDYVGVKPAGTSFQVILPTCDGDVWSDVGMNFYDRIRNDPTRTGAASQIVFAGANHNFFNDTWAEDDNEYQLTRSCEKSVMVGDGVAQPAKAAQRGMLSLLMSDWYGATLRGEPMVPFLRGETNAPAYYSAWAGVTLDMRSSYSAAHHKVVDDFSGAEAPATNALGKTNVFTAFEQSLACGGAACDQGLGVCTNNACNGDTGRCTGAGCDNPFQLYDRATLLQAVGLSWSAKGARATIDLGGVDATSYGALSFRIAAADSPLNPAGAAQSFSVVVTDANGKSVTLPLSSMQTVPRLYTVRPAGNTTADVRPPKEIFQTVRVSKAKLTGLALNALSKIEIVADGAATGAAYVTDVELSD